MRTKAAIKITLTYAIWIVAAIAVILVATAAGGTNLSEFGTETFWESKGFVRAAISFITGAFVAIPGLTVRRALRKGASFRQLVVLGIAVSMTVVAFSITNIVSFSEQEGYKIVTPMFFAVQLSVITAFFAYRLGKIKAGVLVSTVIVMIMSCAMLAVMLPYYDVDSAGLTKMYAGSMADVTVKDIPGLFAAAAISFMIYIFSDIEKSRHNSTAHIEAMDILTSSVLAIIASFYCGIINLVGIAAPLLAIRYNGNRFAGRNFFCGMTGGIIMVVSDMTEQLTGVPMGFVALAISGVVVVGIKLSEGKKRAAIVSGFKG